MRKSWKSIRDPSKKSFSRISAKRLPLIVCAWYAINCGECLDVLLNSLDTQCTYKYNGDRKEHFHNQKRIRLGVGYNEEGHEKVHSDHHENEAQYEDNSHVQG